MDQYTRSNKGRIYWHLAIMSGDVNTAQQLSKKKKKEKGCEWKQMERTVPSVPRRAPSVSTHKQHWDSFFKPKSAFSRFQGNAILLFHAAVNLSPKDLLNSHCYDFQPAPQSVVF